MCLDEVNHEDITMDSSMAGGASQVYHVDEDAPAVGSGEGIREALGKGRPALDAYQRHRLLPNMVGPYLTGYEPSKDIWQHLGQFTYNSHTYHNHAGVLQ